jgi:hypothetical protein
VRRAGAAVHPVHSVFASRRPRGHPIPRRGLAYRTCAKALPGMSTVCGVNRVARRAYEHLSRAVTKKGRKTNCSTATVRYAPRLLTINHHGPILHGHIHGELSKVASANSGAISRSSATSHAAARSGPRLGQFDLDQVRVVRRRSTRGRDPRPVRWRSPGCRRRPCAG